MKKILATLAVAGLAVSAACSAVDTPDTTSAAPVTITQEAADFSAARSDLTRFGMYGEERPTRSVVARPVKPTVVKPVVKPKPVAAKPKHKVVKPVKKVHKTKKPVVHKKKTVYKKKVKSHRAPGGIAACIRKYESGGNYRAQNRRSSASGAYQFLDSTWHRLGYSGRAMNASPATQDAAFYRLWNGGRGASQWTTAHRCGY